MPARGLVAQYGVLHARGHTLLTLRTPVEAEPRIFVRVRAVPRQRLAGDALCVREHVPDRHATGASAAVAGPRPSPVDGPLGLD